MTHRIGFVNMTQRTEYPFWNMSHRNEPFSKRWLKELAPFFQYDSKNWTFETLTQRIQYFLKT